MYDAGELGVTGASVSITNSWLLCNRSSTVNATLPSANVTVAANATFGANSTRPANATSSTGNSTQSALEPFLAQASSNAELQQALQLFSNQSFAPAAIRINSNFSLVLPPAWPPAGTYQLRQPLTLQGPPILDFDTDLHQPQAWLDLGQVRGCGEASQHAPRCLHGQKG